MANIIVFDGTGYTGGHVVREATSRGHHVVSVSRSHPKDPIERVRHEVGSVEELGAWLIPGTDVVVATLAPDFMTSRVSLCVVGQAPGGGRARDCACAWRGST